MLCTICSSKSKVKDVRLNKKENKMRRRECVKGHIFSSYEITEERMAELIDYETAMRKIQRVIEEYE